MTSSTIASDHPLTVEAQQLLRSIAGQIVPASATYGVPGADDEHLFQDILSSAISQAEDIKTALEIAADLDPAEWEGHLGLAPLVVLVMQCYYRDDRVLEALGEEARPPFPLGYEVEQGDWSMLEPVQQRGKIWRDA